MDTKLFRIREQRPGEKGKHMTMSILQPRLRPGRTARCQLNLSRNCLMDDVDAHQVRMWLAYTKWRRHKDRAISE